jgi:hypothetical protein
MMDVGHHAKADTITSAMRATNVYAISLSLVMYEYSFEVDKVHHPFEIDYSVEADR